MSKKTDRAAYGPSWTEVILGAVLSVVLGVVLGAALMILRPVVVPKGTPKADEKVIKGAVYYHEGTRDSTKAKQAPEKRKAFAAGQSVTVVEDELNALASPAPAAAPAAAPKGGDKAKTADKGKAAGKAEAPAASGAFVVGAPNFRIRDGVMQIAAPVTDGFDLGLKMIAQARGGIAKDGNTFVFEPKELYLGSCPVQRIPFLNAYVRDKFLSAQPIPDDIKTAWSKLTNAVIEGNTLKLTMP
jgi:hypothetical protein